MNLREHVNKGLLLFHSSRPTLHGLEMHLVEIHKKIESFNPSTIVLDPITNLVTVGSMSEVKGMLIRLIDFLQRKQITVMFTALNLNTSTNTQADEGVSSLVDAWISVRDVESNGERNRGLYIMKSRGMKHSNQIREFMITDQGLQLVDVYLGPGGILIGSARETQQLEEATGVELRNYALSRKDREIERKKTVLEAKIASLHEEFESIKDELGRTYQEEELKKQIMNKNRNDLTKKRYLINNVNSERRKK
jgi:circadian clock protein KaiC